MSNAVAQPATAADRTVPRQIDRFVAFAFAPADLLVEIGGDGVITWASGAFASRLGAGAECFVGKHFGTLIAATDHPVLAMVMASAFLHGRLPPTVVRLADAQKSTVTMAALAIPGAQTRLGVSIGPLATAPSDPAASMQDKASFAREAEGWLRGGQTGNMGLIDLKGWGPAMRAMGKAERAALLAAIDETLSQAAGASVVTGQIADGRYGVLAQDGIAMPDLARKIEQLVRASEAARSLHVESMTVPLAAGALTGQQAVRALRLALSRFSDEDSSIAAMGGMAHGLGEFIGAAQARSGGMRAAIQDRRFQLAYQPIVSLTDRHIHHYEALLRPIPTPGSPVTKPQDFVMLAEAAGLAEELDLAVLEQVIAIVGPSADVSVAFNASGLSVQSPAFAARAMAMLSAAGPGVARRLLVELTETAEVENFSTASATLKAMHDSGLAVCIDDFGAGAAAFRYLREFEVDVVKIDGSYVQGAARSARERGFVSSMVDLARSVEAKVVAEMIETEAQATLMKQLGVDLGQGWLYGKPGKLPGSGHRG